MKRLLLIILLIATSAPSLLAEDTIKKRLADDLIVNFSIKESTNFNVEKVADLIIENEPQFKPYREVLIDFYTRHLTWEKIKPTFENIIMKEFSEDDLVRINEFLRSKAFKDWTESSGDIKTLPEAEQNIILEFTGKDLGIHFFKVTEDFVTASNKFIGKVTLENKEELEAMIKKKTKELTQ